MKIDRTVIDFEKASIGRIINIFRNIDNRLYVHLQWLYKGFSKNNLDLCINGPG